MQAAAARNIPFRRLTDGSLVTFGWGSRQRKIQAAEMDRTGAIAEAIAQDKELTKKLLDAAGVPVPHGRVALDAGDAWAAALEIGLPVVIKPKDGNQGKGVTVNITTKEQMHAGFAAASEFRDDILVERYLPGNDFRLLVVGDKLVAAARRDPPQVIGDGVKTVRQLVDQVNLDPRRGNGRLFYEVGNRGGKGMLSTFQKAAGSALQLGLNLVGIVAAGVAVLVFYRLVTKRLPRGASLRLRRKALGSGS